MRGIARHRVGRVAALLWLAATLGACGDDSPCNHVIQDVARFEDCKEIAVERRCSDEVTYSTKNKRCKVENCGDCDGPLPTPTAVPVS